MAEHLVAGKFDIDPDAIDAEAFELGDRVVSYFGIFCALLRMPLLPFPAWAHLDIARVSCLAALALGTWFQLRAVLLVRDACPPGARRDWLTVALIVCIVLGGQQIQFLRFVIYQEIVNWGNALAMGFVFLAMRGVLRGFDVRTLTGMAAFAGFALLDRVTFGIGLYAALGGVLLLRWRLAFWPGVVLGLFIAVTAVVNYGRWGDPTVFADFTKYALNQDVTPDRMGRIVAYGPFNWRRLGIGLSYYFVPVWAWLGSDGHLPFAETKAASIDALELPPGSFFLSDPFLLGLAAVGVWRLVRTKALPPPPRGRAGKRGGRSPVRAVSTPARFSLALLAGFAVQPVLMLTAISMNYRYRVEFYPLFVFAALLGFLSLCRAQAVFGRTARTAIVATVMVSVLASHGMAALYAVSPWGPADIYLERDGWIGTYLPRLIAGHD
jgi:hypothetical protein